MENQTQGATASGVANESHASRRKSAAARRKESVIATELPAEILQASDLNEADRRLAEMGYTQVCFPRALSLHHSFRVLTLQRALGL